MWHEYCIDVVNTIEWRVFYVVSMTRLWRDLSNLRLSASQSAHNEEATLKPVRMETARLQGSQPLARGTDIIFEELWEPWRKNNEIFGKWASDATADTYPSNWEITWSSGEKVTLTSLHSAKCNIIIRLYLIHEIDDTSKALSNEGETWITWSKRMKYNTIPRALVKPFPLSMWICKSGQEKMNNHRSFLYEPNRIQTFVSRPTLWPDPSPIPFICFQETSCWTDRSVMDMNQNVPYIVKKLKSSMFKTLYFSKMKIDLICYIFNEPLSWLLPGMQQNNLQFESNTSLKLCPEIGLNFLSYFN